MTRPTQHLPRPCTSHRQAKALIQPPPPDAGPRKRVLLYLINLQFKIFFRINSLQLCKTLTRAVETRGFPDLESFPMAQQVTFCYYRGRLHIFSEEYVRRVAWSWWGLDATHLGRGASVMKVMQGFVNHLVPC